MKQTVLAIVEHGVFRPLTQHFLREGQRVTLRIEPIEELPPEEAARRQAELLRSMETEGWIETEPVSLTGPMPQNFEPLPVQGESLSETIINMRGER